VGRSFGAGLGKSPPAVADAAATKLAIGYQNETTPRSSVVGLLQTMAWARR